MDLMIVLGICTFKEFWSELFMVNSFKSYVRTKMCVKSFFHKYILILLIFQRSPLSLPYKRTEMKGIQYVQFGNQLRVKEYRVQR